MSGPSPAPGFSLGVKAGHASQMARLPDGMPNSTGSQAHHTLRKGYCPYPRSTVTWPQCCTRTVCLSEFIQGGRLGHGGALKPVGTFHVSRS